MVADSILQKQVRLAKLLDLDSFRDVMQSFADLYRIGVKIFDAEGTKLVDVRVGASACCAYLFQHARTKAACTKIVHTLKHAPLNEMSGEVRHVDCFSGMRYAVTPIAHEGGYLGRVIFGPYLPKEAAQLAPSLRQLEPGLDPARLEHLGSQIRIASSQTVLRLMLQLKQFIDVILFTSYRAMLTSQMHIESVTEGYHELVAKNRDLADANERLKELDRLKSNFLAMVSHELRTPLTSIIGYAEMLSEGMAGDLNQEQGEFVATIMEKGENLLQLISSLLEISRVESGKIRLDLVDLKLAAVVDAAVSSVLPQITKRKITFERQVANDLPQISADRDKVRQVLINLLGNAVKFTPEQGTITLVVDRFFGARPGAETGSGSSAERTSVFDLDEEDFVRILVRDSGVGIPPDQHQRIFESFYQVDNTATREFGGSGLGLSIVKSFVEAHRGEVWVDSTPGQGSTFTVLLPSARA